MMNPLPLPIPRNMWSLPLEFICWSHTPPVDDLREPHLLTQLLQPAFAENYPIVLLEHREAPQYLKEKETSLYHKFSSQMDYILHVIHQVSSLYDLIPKQYHQQSITNLQLFRHEEHIQWLDCYLSWPIWIQIEFASHEPSCAHWSTCGSCPILQTRFCSKVLEVALILEWRIEVRWRLPDLARSMLHIHRRHYFQLDLATFWILEECEDWPLLCAFSE